MQATLCKAWLDAKKEEDAAKAKRIDIEHRMLKKLGPIVEGSTTKKQNGFKITVKMPIYRKVDGDYRSVLQQIPPSLNPITEIVTTKVDAKGCRWLQENEPGYWQKLSKVITERPGKPGFKIERVNHV